MAGVLNGKDSLGGIEKMKRRQEGTKILVIGIAGMLLAIGAGCGAGRGEPFSGKDPGMEIREVPGGEQDALLDWQSQYDLGIRLLGEGKYQEAIIAFTAAIEIEPSRAALYAARGDAYMAMGAEGMGTTGTDGFGMAGGAGADGSETDRTGTDGAGDPKLSCSYAAQDYAQAAILLWERYQGEGGWTAAAADGTGNLEQTEGMLPEGMSYGDLLEKVLEAHEKLAQAYADAGDLEKAVDTMNAICGILGGQVMVVEEDAGQDGQGEGQADIQGFGILMERWEALLNRAGELLQQYRSQWQEENKPLVELTGQQREWMDRLSAYMEAGDYGGAGRYACDYVDGLMELWAEVCEYNCYLYKDGKMLPDIQGYGLVLGTAWRSDPAVGGEPFAFLYYGSFQNGKPEGNCRYLCASVSHGGMQCDTAVGEFKAGLLDGYGRLERIDYGSDGVETGYRWVIEGTFAEGLGEGDFSDITYMPDGGTMTFTYKASGGLPVADERWETTEYGDKVLRCQEYYSGILGSQGAGIGEEGYFVNGWNSSYWN